MERYGAWIGCTIRSWNDNGDLATQRLANNQTTGASKGPNESAKSRLRAKAVTSAIWTFAHRMSERVFWVFQPHARHTSVLHNAVRSARHARSTRDSGRLVSCTNATCGMPKEAYVQPSRASRASRCTMACSHIGVCIGHLDAPPAALGSGYGSPDC